MNHLFVALCFKLCPDRAEAIGETCSEHQKKDQNWTQMERMCSLNTT